MSIDSHCHLADAAFADDLDAVVARARAAGLQHALCILAADDDPETAQAKKLAALWPAVRFAIGAHPHQAKAFAARARDLPGVLDSVRAANPRVCAVGEIGLDYHYDFAPRDVQHEVFAAQVAHARERDLPVVIHTREATDDTFAVLLEAGRGQVRGVFHCFTGNAATARAAIDLGFYLGFSGIVTFPKAGELRAIARWVPADRLLIETDAPYLAPVPHRGRRNEPAYVVQVAQIIAAERGVALDDLAAQAEANFIALFRP